MPHAGAEVVGRFVDGGIWLSYFVVSHVWVFGYTSIACVCLLVHLAGWVFQQHMSVLYLDTNRCRE